MKELFAALFLTIKFCEPSTWKPGEDRCRRRALIGFNPAGIADEMDAVAGVALAIVAFDEAGRSECQAVAGIGGGDAITHDCCGTATRPEPAFWETSKLLNWLLEAFEALIPEAPSFGRNHQRQPTRFGWLGP